MSETNRIVFSKEKTGIILLKYHRWSDDRLQGIGIIFLDKKLFEKIRVMHLLVRLTKGKVRGFDKVGAYCNSSSVKFISPKLHYATFGIGPFMSYGYYINEYWHIEQPSKGFLRFSHHSHSLKIECGLYGFWFSAESKTEKRLYTATIPYEFVGLKDLMPY
jgi:hypothetical protein